MSIKKQQQNRVNCSIGDDREDSKEDHTTGTETDLEQQQQQQQQHHHEEEETEDDFLLSTSTSRSVASIPTRGNGQEQTRLGLFGGALVLAGIIALILTLLLRRWDFLSFSSIQLLPPASKRTYTLYDIYCTGPLLHAVQMMNVTSKRDDKEFVDRPMKADPDHIMAAFHALPDPTSVEVLTEFLDTYFDPAGSDLLPVTPSDFHDRPPRLYNSISNETLREWAIELNAFWKVLGRQPQHIFQDQQPNRRSSLLPTKHLLVVPGGRFRESYYWDTYWIVHGLLASDMYQTAKGVVQNLLDFVDLYGYVPNGGRVYFLTRSQPPLLSEMVRILHEHAPDDSEFLKSATQTLDKEYQFWMQDGKHAVSVYKNGQVHTLNRYISNATEPRPESYRKDVQTGRKAAAAAVGAHIRYNRSMLFEQIIAACESGWDFSSRWLKDQISMETVMTSNIIPVDLNTFMHRMEKNMIHFHKLLENTDKVTMYKQAADDRTKAIEHILWDPSSYMWRDYWIDTEEFSSLLSSSNFFPLWSESLLDGSNTTLLENVQKSFVNSGLIQKGGILTTTDETGQQWDDPNAWPPIQDILIEGLLKYETTRALGERLIQVWIYTGYTAYKLRGHMYEKYNALNDTGKAGGGGEYSIQVGFGWTNGVVLKLLTTHASLLNNL